MKLVVPLVPRWVRWLGVVVVAGFLFYTSIITVPPEIGVNEDVFGLLADLIGFAQDKWQHFVAYGTLAYALAYASDHWQLDRWTHALFVIGVVSLYGVGIEIGQLFLPYRFFDVNDIIANVLGAMLVLPWFWVRPHVEVRPVGELL